MNCLTNRLGIIRTPAFLYVIVNLFVSAVSFVRSFIFMNHLGMSELGLISLFQTVIQFISLFQFGLLNGGYRLFSLNKFDDQRNVNNLLFTFVLFLSIIFSLCWFILRALNIELLMSSRLLLLAIICGLLSLLNNWLTNTLLGKRKLKQINCINLSASVSSLCLLPLVALLGFRGAVVVIFAQPTIFVLLTLVFNKDLRPTGLYFDLKLVKYILSFGFIPFLSGICATIYLQIERWGIGNVLGTEALGNFYLVFLFSTLFILVPNSLNSIFFPKCVRSYDEGEINETYQLLKRYALIILAYDVFVILVSITLLNPVVSVVFPAHAPFTKYVFYLLPGLVLSSFSGVLTTLLNASVRLSPMMVSGVICVMVYLFSVILMGYFNNMTLTKMAALKSIVFTIDFLIYFVYCIHNRKKISLGYKNTNNVK